MIKKALILLFVLFSLCGVSQSVVMGIAGKAVKIMPQDSIVITASAPYEGYIFQITANPVTDSVSHGRTYTAILKIYFDGVLNGILNNNNNPYYYISSPIGTHTIAIVHKAGSYFGFWGTGESELRISEIHIYNSSYLSYFCISCTYLEYDVTNIIHDLPDAHSNPCYCGYCFIGCGLTQEQTDSLYSKRWRLD